MKKTVLLLTVFITNPVYAILVTDDTPNVCAFVNNSITAHAIFERDEYICDAGEYLPANINRCISCPSEHSCTGGTYTFNESFAQGIIYNHGMLSNIPYGCDNHIQKMSAMFEANEHICEPGEYMPANYDGCAICPENSYCAGGTYTFNETVAQGIVSCGNGLYAPSGMALSNQCGRILHIGDEIVYLHSVKKTSPALHIDIDNDGVADFFGNMTTLDVPMTNGTQHKLKISYDGQTYSVYDDSVDLSQYQN